MRIVTFGETMLRLKSPGAERFFQSPSLEATFGGSESNVAVSLSLFGENASFVTVFPDNPLADAAVASLRGFGVDTSGIVRVPGRMGLYFVESGACQRAGRVVYDRADSALALAPPDAIDWPTVLDGAYLLHLTGITPSISARAADAAILAAATAKEMGVRVSLDFNLRMNLWKYGKLPIEVIPILLMYADICIANEEQIAIALGLELEGGGAVDRRARPEPVRPSHRKGRRNLPEHPRLRHHAARDGFGRLQPPFGGAPHARELLRLANVRDLRHRRPNRRRRRVRRRPDLRSDALRRAVRGARVCGRRGGTQALRSR
ncbi:MAG: sugar kinase [Thermoguttaceae bacterium]|nr:sugar kinase [Thermoguttaceae bacterium]